MYVFFLIHYLEYKEVYKLECIVKGSSKPFSLNLDNEEAWEEKIYSTVQSGLYV